MRPLLVLALSAMCLVLVSTEAHPTSQFDEIIREDDPEDAALSSRLSSAAAEAAEFLGSRGPSVPSLKEVAKRGVETTNRIQQGLPDWEKALDGTSFAKQVDRWDAETSGALDDEVESGSTVQEAVGAEVGSSKEDHPQGEVDTAHQGNRVAQHHMLEAAENAMVDSAEAMQGNEHMATAAPRPTPPPGSPPAPPPVPKPRQEVMPAVTVAPVHCTTVATCQHEAQTRVGLAGDAVGEAREATAKGEAKRAARWQQLAAAQKEAAVNATVLAREMTTQQAQAEAARVEARRLAKARGIENTQKAKTKREFDFEKKVASEADAKQGQKLTKAKAAQEIATDHEAQAKSVAKLAENKALAAEVAAQKDKTVANRAAASQARAEANKAFDHAETEKGNAVERETKADTIGADIVRKKHLKVLTAACDKGYNMAQSLCGMSHKSAMIECNAMLAARTISGSKCPDAAKHKLTVCNSLATSRRNECSTLAAASTEGASISGYVLRLGASVQLENYSRKQDFDLRKAVSRRVGVASGEVVTLSVKAVGDETMIQVAIAGPEAPLHAKVMALLAAFSAGAPVGGIMATEAAVKYYKELRLPGQKPAAWASEQAQKAWEVSQAETRKLVGMPSATSAREGNEKAHAAEMAAKKALAMSKTQEYKLKKTSTELTTKVETRNAQKRMEAQVREAEVKANSGLGSLSKTTDGSNMDHYSGQADKGGVTSSGDADFQVIRQRWWKHRSSWLLTHYPALHVELAKAMKPAEKHTSNFAGDQLWKIFLLNWFYTKGREKMGYRYTWNADASYSPVRHLVLGCQRYEPEGGTDKASVYWENAGPSSHTTSCHSRNGAASKGQNVHSVAIRSVNNLCYPGVAAGDAKAYLPAGGSSADLHVDSRSRACATTSAVSVRLSRFRLVKPKRASSSGLMRGVNGAPAMHQLRAYRSINPQHYSRTLRDYADLEDEGLMGVHRVKWSINMVAEYCEVPLKDGTAAPYNEAKSWPRRLHETGTMRWTPITVNNQQQKNSDMMLTVMRLFTKNNKLGITCRTPQVAGVVDGRLLTPTDTKCDITVNKWNYQLSCPIGKQRGLAVLTSVMTRYDDAQAPKDLSEALNVDLDSARHLAMKFQKVSGLRVLHPNGQWENRGSVHMRMAVSQPHWIPEQKFQSHRHYAFSFGLENDQVTQLASSELVWDPSISSHFRQTSAEEEDLPSPPLQAAAGPVAAQAVGPVSPFSKAPVTLSDFLGVSTSVYDKAEAQRYADASPFLRAEEDTHARHGWRYWVFGGVIAVAAVGSVLKLHQEKEGVQVGLH